MSVIHYFGLFFFFQDIFTPMVQIEYIYVWSLDQTYQLCLLL